MTQHSAYDYLIIGGGIFGAYAALYLAKKGLRICVIEKEIELFKKATVVNQARLHSGYHYPRSVATAAMSNDNKERFTEDHKPFILFEYEKYYAIDKFSSFTDSLQYERFCDYLNIKCEPVKDHPLFNYSRMEAVYSTIEYTFDPYLIAEYYRQQLDENDLIEVRNVCYPTEAEAWNGRWKVELCEAGAAQTKTVVAGGVINATYSGTNPVNRIFGVRDVELQHEISEIALVSSKALQHIGLTIMDGQFGSIMPFGLSGLLSLSAVAYTHHKVTYDNLPVFDCQQRSDICSPELPGNCNLCPAKPRSNQRKMINQINQYFSDRVQIDYFTSLFTIKTKLKSSYIDDGRPTEISLLNQNPPFYCIFAGKINSIYEIEKVIP